MDLFQIMIFVGVGFIGGIWNAIAGGATLFTFPALVAAGLPPVIANATNYLALMPANAAALPAYRKELMGVRRTLIPLLIVSGIGAILGAVLLVIADPEVFMVMIPFLILVATLLFAFGETIRQFIIQTVGSNNSTKALYAALFIVSIYGGFFGAGVSIIMLAIVQIMGQSDFHVANSIKNLLATSFTILSIGVFGLGGLVDWPVAFIMMTGSAAGGYLGGSVAKKLNQTLLRSMVIAFGAILTIAYFIKTFG